MGAMLSDRLRIKSGRAHGTLLQVIDKVAAIKKRHEDACIIRSLGTGQHWVVVVLMSHARPALPRTTCVDLG